MGVGGDEVEALAVFGVGDGGDLLLSGVSRSKLLGASLRDVLLPWWAVCALMRELADASTLTARAVVVDNG